MHSHEFQETIKPGDYVWRPFLSMPPAKGTINLVPEGVYLDIYMQIIEPEYDEDRAMFKTLPDLRLANCYSKICIEGDLAQTVQLYYMIPISAGLWYAARSSSWQLSLERFVELRKDGVFILPSLAKPLLAGEIKGLDYDFNLRQPIIWEK